MKNEVAEKLDRIALYLTEQRMVLPLLQKYNQQWESLFDAVRIIEAARKSL